MFIGYTIINFAVTNEFVYGYIGTLLSLLK